MSLFADIASFGQTALDIYRTVQQPQAPTIMQAGLPLSMGALPTLTRALPAVIGAGAGMMARGAGAVFRSAQTYCRRHPQWCATIGGTAAVGAMIESGQLPVIKRRRGRGLTPRDLRSFRRVASLIKGYCPTVRRVPTGKLRKGC